MSKKLPSLIYHVCVPPATHFDTCDHVPDEYEVDLCDRTPALAPPSGRLIVMCGSESFRKYTGPKYGLPDRGSRESLIARTVCPTVQRIERHTRNSKPL